ncbi:glutathione binding-like protein [Hydrogenophaga sp.]|uniref:glutathione binding-like protein n=1 Tax=Hydrogenophaga sp. TaxID=1904254 RepID=UPI003D10F56F
MSAPAALYFSPLACSFASHLVVRETGLTVRLVPVSLRRQQLDDGAAFRDLAPKGQVPVLQFDDGRLLTENMAVLLALARSGGMGLPEEGTATRDELLEWLSFVGTEIHKLCLYPMFQRDAPDAVKEWARARLASRLRTVADRLSERPYLVSDAFTVADAYLVWALMLCEQSGEGFQGVQGLDTYWARMKSRPAYGATLAHEARLYPTLA